MNLVLALSLAALAGMLNGSYPRPMKTIQHWPEANIWLAFSLLTFLMAPLLMIYWIQPHHWQALQSIPYQGMYWLIGGGLLFGGGMIIFTYSLRYVGIGIAFILNIAMGTIAGNLVPSFLLSHGFVTSWAGLLDFASMLLFTVGIVFSILAVRHHGRALFHGDKLRQKMLGCALGLISGLLTSAQGITYAMTLPTLLHQPGVSPFELGLIPWAVIFPVAFVPYSLYFITQVVKGGSLGLFIGSRGHVQWFKILLMAFCYMMGLLLFSYAATSLGRLGPIFAWPIMMIFIILTANFWGLRSGEWQQASAQGKGYLAWSILMLCLAIVTIGISATLI